MCSAMPYTDTGTWYPDQQQCFDMFMNLLPRGRAWQTDEGSLRRERSVLKSFWWGVAGFWSKFELAAAEAVDEWFCETADIDAEQWRLDYYQDISDDCDPFADACAKILGLAELSIEAYEEFAANLGWAATLRFLTGSDPEFPGVRSTLYAQLDLDASIAVDPVNGLGDFVLDTGRLGIGFAFSGAGIETTEEDAIDRFSCIFDRVLPAHVALIVEVTS